ncbi:hypothetical protein [Desulfofalx alkaliphila]|uniref:hypothetical protein n=1 Tax=Desulfofalx alkaliphila TaxID=105483 RepID=UPI0004E18606|nr:hypothetical protein [Desulfofalx alkaliphila]
MTILQKKFNKRKQMKILLYIDYCLQQFNEANLSTGNIKMKVTKSKDNFIVHRLDENTCHPYSRLKDLVNDLDQEILDKYDPFVGMKP